MNYIEKIRRLNPQISRLPVEMIDTEVLTMTADNCQCICGKRLFISFGPRGYEYLHRVTESRFCDFGSSNRVATPKG